MNATVITVIISSFTSLVVILISEYFRRILDKKTRANKINLEYLNPLRLHLEETYIRLQEIERKVAAHGNLPSLLYIKDANELPAQKKEWFVNEGAYLVSSAYLAACLFASIKKVREDIPYLRLRGNKDTILLNLIFKVSHGFLQNLGVFYVIQHNIGDQMFDKQSGKIKSYREFCSDLSDPETLVWYSRLINFLIETGQGKYMHRISSTAKAIYELSGFLDLNLQGGPSLIARMKMEVKQVYFLSSFSAGISSPFFSIFSLASFTSEEMGPFILSCGSVLCSVSGSGCVTG